MPTDAEMKAYYRKKDRTRNRYALWKVSHGGPEENTTVGVFASKADALLVYRATRLIQWAGKSETMALGLGRGLAEIGADIEDGRGGRYCAIDGLDWVAMSAMIVVPKVLPLKVEKTLPKRRKPPKHGRDE